MCIIVASEEHPEGETKLHPSLVKVMEGSSTVQSLANVGDKGGSTTVQMKDTPTTDAAAKKKLEVETEKKKAEEQRAMDEKNTAIVKEVMARAHAAAAEVKTAHSTTEEKNEAVKRLLDQAKEIEREARKDGQVARDAADAAKKAKQDALKTQSDAVVALKEAEVVNVFAKAKAAEQAEMSQKKTVTAEQFKVKAQSLAAEVEASKVALREEIVKEQALSAADKAMAEELRKTQAEADADRKAARAGIAEVEKAKDAVQAAAKAAIQNAVKNAAMISSLEHKKLLDVEAKERAHKNVGTADALAAQAQTHAEERMAKHEVREAKREMEKVMFEKERAMQQVASKVQSELMKQKATLYQNAAAALTSKEGEIATLTKQLLAARSDPTTTLLLQGLFSPVPYESACGNLAADPKKLQETTAQTIGACAAECASLLACRSFQFEKVCVLSGKDVIENSKYGQMLACPTKNVLITAAMKLSGNPTTFMKKVAQEESESELFKEDLAMDELVLVDVTSKDKNSKDKEDVVESQIESEHFKYDIDMDQRYESLVIDVLPPHTQAHFNRPNQCNDDLEAKQKIVEGYAQMLTMITKQSPVAEELGTSNFMSSKKRAPKKPKKPEVNIMSSKQRGPKKLKAAGAVALITTTVATTATGNVKKLEAAAAVAAVPPGSSNITTTTEATTATANVSANVRQIEVKKDPKEKELTLLQAQRDDLSTEVHNLQNHTSYEEMKVSQRKAEAEHAEETNVELRKRAAHQAKRMKRLRQEVAKTEPDTGHEYAQFEALAEEHRNQLKMKQDDIRAKRRCVAKGMKDFQIAKKEGIARLEKIKGTVAASKTQLALTRHALALCKANLVGTDDRIHQRIAKEEDRAEKLAMASYNEAAEMADTKKEVKREAKEIVAKETKQKEEAFVAKEMEKLTTKFVTPKCNGCLKLSKAEIKLLGVNCDGC